MKHEIRKVPALFRLANGEERRDKVWVIVRGALMFRFAYDEGSPDEVRANLERDWRDDELQKKLNYVPAPEPGKPIILRRPTTRKFAWLIVDK